MIEQKSKHIEADGVDITIPRATPYTGKAIISRFKGSFSDYSVQNRRLINLLSESNIATGELVQTAKESYLIIVSKPEVVQGQNISIIAHGILCNVTITVSRDTPVYDDDGNLIDTTQATVLSGLCRADMVTARMRQEDPGLLPTTLLKVYAPYDSSLQLLDKVQLGNYSNVIQPPTFIPYGEYRLDVINRLEIPGVMVLQLSAWTG